MRGRSTGLQTTVFLFILLAPAILEGRRAMAAGPPAEATSAFDNYCSQVEERLEQPHRPAGDFLAPEGWERLRRGDPIIEQIQPPGGSNLPGAMLHHWRGTAFVPGATAADFDRLMKDFSDYPTRYAPQILVARVIAQQEDRFQVMMRVRQKHVITVVLDTAYDIAFKRLDAEHGYSLSRSTRISEIESPGAPNERALGPTEDHGFLWRLNTYWSYEERDGGLYMQIESVSLSRSIPAGLAWAIKPFVESVPRESLEFTLRATCNALRK
jgi:hypothetical protein